MSNEAENQDTGDQSTGDQTNQNQQNAGEDTSTTEVVLGGDTGDTSTGNGDENTGDAAAAGSDADTGAPETYADFELPEGVELDSEYLNELKADFKELGLTQEAAQKLVTNHAKRIQASQESRVEAFNQLTKDWLSSAKSDKEIGGEAFDQNVGLARSALEKFGTPELNGLLRDYGIGNHPEVIRVFTRVGKLLKEDQPGNSGANTSKPPSREEILYPSSAEN